MRRIDREAAETPSQARDEKSLFPALRAPIIDLCITMFLIFFQ
jgi:hypothetical protein